jgi:hypothetical protein
VINLIRLRGLTNLPGRMAAAAFEHHLNYDLSGYPMLSMPWELSLTGRILMVADCYDSMTSSRVYRRDPIAPNKVLTMMFAKSGILYDPVLLKLFVNCVGIIPIGCLALLDSHELAVVIRPSANRQTATRPYVKLISDRSGNPIDGSEVDLAEMDADGRGENSAEQMASFIRRAEGRIAIVSGECYQRLFANFSFLLACEEFLASKGVLELVLSAANVDVDDIGMEAHLGKFAPDLLHMKQTYSDQVQLFLSDKRPVQHYGVADGRHMYFEDPDHAEGKLPGVLFRYDDPEFGKEWVTRFSRYLVKRCNAVVP